MLYVSPAAVGRGLGQKLSAGTSTTVVVASDYRARRLYYNYTTGLLGSKWPVDFLLPIPTRVADLDVVESNTSIYELFE